MIHGSRIPDLTDGAKFGRLSLPGYTHTYICILIINMCIYIYIYVRLKSVNLLPLTESPPKLRLQKKSQMYSPKKVSVNVMCEWGSHFFPPKKKQKHPFEGLAHPKMLRELVNAQMHQWIFARIQPEFDSPRSFFVVVKSSTLWPVNLTPATKVPPHWEIRVQ